MVFRSFIFLWKLVIHTNLSQIRLQLPTVRWAIHDKRSLSTSFFVPGFFRFKSYLIVFQFLFHWIENIWINIIILKLILKFFTYLISPIYFDKNSKNSAYYISMINKIKCRHRKKWFARVQIFRLILFISLNIKNWELYPALKFIVTIPVALFVTLELEFCWWIPLWIKWSEIIFHEKIFNVNCNPAVFL